MQVRGLHSLRSFGLLHPSLAGLVVVAGGLNPIPSRTRPLNSPAPMVLSLKTWKSRSLPGLQRTDTPHHDERIETARRGKPWRAVFCFGAASKLDHAIRRIHRKRRFGPTFPCDR